MNFFNRHDGDVVTLSGHNAHLTILFLFFLNYILKLQSRNASAFLENAGQYHPYIKQQQFISFLIYNYRWRMLSSTPSAKPVCVFSSGGLARPAHGTRIIAGVTTLQRRKSTFLVRSGFLDQAWGVGIDQKTLTETIPQNLFAFSIIPYIGFLYHLTKSKDTPKLTLFGFYFLLVFVFATIPAGIYAKKVYHTTLANVDYLHGTAEFMLTLTNLFVVLGLQQKINSIETAAKEEE